MYHNLKTTLYHGTASEIQKVDVELGRGSKDFGRGFYMAVSKNQAVGMMHKKYREAAKRILLNNLETENLGIQYFVGKQEVADKVIADIKLIDWR